MEEPSRQSIGSWVGHDWAQHSKPIHLTSFFMQFYVHDRSESTLEISPCDRWLTSKSQQFTLYPVQRPALRPPWFLKKRGNLFRWPKLPRVMQNSLSFVFQPLWGHLGQWLFEDPGGLCWAHPGIHPQDSGLYGLRRITSFSIFHHPAVQLSYLKAPPPKQNTRDYNIQIKWQYTNLYMQSDSNYTNTGKEMQIPAVVSLL